MWLIIFPPKTTTLIKSDFVFLWFPCHFLSPEAIQNHISLLTEPLWLPFTSPQKFHSTVYCTLHTRCSWPQVWSHLPFPFWVSLIQSLSLNIFLWRPSLILWKKKKVSNKSTICCFLQLTSFVTKNRSLISKRKQQIEKTKIIRK